MGFALAGGGTLLFFGQEPEQERGRLTAMLFFGLDIGFMVSAMLVGG